nr:PREDICTED: uncharacterized protein LOC109646090 isoform X2 [Paralichthys olivaceus]
MRRRGVGAEEEARAGENTKRERKRPGGGSDCSDVRTAGDVQIKPGRVRQQTQTRNSKELTVQGSVSGNVCCHRSRPTCLLESLTEKGFWSEMLGVGDFYYELGVQIIEVCLALKHRNGGLITLDELHQRVLRGRGKYAQDKKGYVTVRSRQVLNGRRSELVVFWITC